MTVGIELTARLMVILALIYYSYGGTTEVPSTIAANTAVVTSTGLADISTSTDSTESSTTVPAISTATQLILSSSEILLGSSTGASPTSSSSSSSPSDQSTSDTPFLTTTSLDTGENSTENAISTASTSSPTTTTSTSTSIPPTTTNPLPPGTQQPDFAAAPPFKMTFSIGYDEPWDDSFRECSGNTVCQAFQEKIQTEIDLAFIGCPGYENGSIVVIRFYNSNEEARHSSVRQLQAAQFAANGNGTYADYNASFDSFTILSQPTEVVSYIDSTVEANLASNPEVINGSTDGMAEAADAQVSEFKLNSCNSIGKDICISICYPCANGNMYNYNVGCQTKCDEDHICTEGPDKAVSCVCKPDHLPFGDDCVHENLIIGICAGVGGAIVLALLIAAIVMGCKLKKKNKQYEHMVESNSHHRAEAYEMAKHNGVQKSASAHDVELHDVGHSSAHKTDSVASAKAEQPNGIAKQDHHNHYKPEHAQKVDGLKTDHDDTPGASAIDLQNKQSDQYRDLYYSKPDNPGSSSSPSDPYAYFIARLNTVDVNKEYHIKRPQFEHPHYSNGSAF